MLGMSGCSQSEVSVHDSSWRCHKQAGTRTCLIDFTVRNNSDFVTHATLKMRAYSRSRVGDAITLEVVGKDEMAIRLSPKEARRMQHVMTLHRPVSQIVLSAYASRGN